MSLIDELRPLLADKRLGWDIPEHIPSDMEIPTFGLGADPAHLIEADPAKRIDFKKVLQPAPHFQLEQRRIARGIIEKQAAVFAGPAPDDAGTHPASVDWRNRWGGAWITSIRDQDNCEACWAFASTALVEAMTRIEHAVWTWRSEGDVHKGSGAVCATTGGPDGALDWMRDHDGLADPDCFAWTTADAGYNPTPDRTGRTVKIGDHTDISNTDDQKAWLDTVGPLTCGFEVWHDFDVFGWAHSTGVYKKADTPGNYDRGSHIMLIVGYDDGQNCWICKNSWGAGFGVGGYVRIGYGECNIDYWSKAGLQGTNPDPWTKRRVHAGNLIESGNGATHRNFEMVATSGGGRLQHWYRENGAPGFAWHTAYAPFGNDAAACPTVTSTTYNRNFELVSLTTSHRLHHWWFDQNAKQWNDGGVFGPPDAAGIPGFIQSDYGAPGNFEVVVRTADGRLNHWWRMNGPPWTWTDAGRFGNQIAFSGPSLIQSHYGAPHGNLELVCVCAATGQMQHYWKDVNGDGQWHEGPCFGMGVQSAPCMIEGQYAAADERARGNFELCVAVGGQIEHWWRDNYGSGGWQRSAVFGHDVAAVAALMEGSYGFNLEVIVLRSDNQLQHYWRDGAGWHEGVVIGPA